MDAYEATKIVMSRIQSLDPENASRIMGYILIQDQGEKEVIRLALGPDALLLSCLNQAKACLGLSSNAPSPKPLNPLPNSLRPNAFFSPNSPRILIPSNGFQYSYSNPSSPAAAAAPPFPRSSPISYAAVLNGGSSCNTNVNGNNTDSGSPGLRFYGGNELLNSGVRQNGQDQSSFLDGSTADATDPLIFPFGEDGSATTSPHPHPHPFHRRSCSVNDAVFLSHPEEGGVGVGYRPCMYHAKGSCKNGSSCKFLHNDFVGGGGDEAVELGSPSANASSFDEFLRIKALQQQQRFALMAAGGHPPFAYNKGSNFLNDNQRCGPRNDFSSAAMGAAMASSSRQIYLTFPSDSTFKEEDVSSYFSMFGPVNDVRIPYQQKRMFGFVTFQYSDTVKLILAKGNPHYVCDSRVLVKPYKEKGKVPDKRQFQQQNQHLERGEFSSHLSPSALDSNEFYDLQIGSRMLFNTQEMLRRRMEQKAELQHAIELQGQRMANMELMDLKYQQPNNPFLPRFRAGVSIPSPRQSQFFISEHAASFDGANPDVLQEFDDWQETSKAVEADDENSALEETECFSYNNVSNGHIDQHVNDDDSYPHESLEHILPDTLFASPTKSAAERHSAFTLASSEADNPLINTSSNYAPHYSQMTRNSE